jgi:large subunit ribosomal protein L6
MSRIGKKPVIIIKGVTVGIDSGILKVKGPKGELEFNVSPERYQGVNVEIKDDQLLVTRREETRRGRTEQGLVRALIQNMVTGVSEGYSRTLEILGVGYRAEVKGKVLNLNLGFSHPIAFALPEGITVNVDKQNRVTLAGFDKQLVGETAARIRRLRPPEPYKGKGIRYEGEEVRRKVGKAAGAAGG